MILSNLFGREPRAKTDRVASGTEQLHPANSGKNPLPLAKPTSFSDVEGIIDQLKMGKSVLVHLTEVKQETAIRILDMLSGAIYALNGGVYEVQKNIFMFSPTGVEEI